MDSFSSILKKGLTGATRSPVFIIAGLLSGVIGAITLIQYSSLVSAGQSSTLQLIAVSMVVIVMPMLAMPFIIGGALGCAVDQTVGGRATWDRFISSGIKHYMNLLIAGVVAWLVSYFLSLLVTILVLIGMMSGGGGATAILLSLILLPVGAVIMFVGLMFIEFYDIAIVADGADFAKAFGISIGFVRKHLPAVIPFAIIITGVKILVWLPLIAALLMKYVSTIASNLSYYENGTVNTTMLNQSLNATAAWMPSSGFGAPSIIAIMVLQALVQSIAFAFIVTYKAEFYKWRKSIRRITDFDYDFSKEKP